MDEAVQPVLSAAEISALDDIHDTEIPVFLEYMNHAVQDLRRMALFKEVKKSPAAIQKELDKARDVLDGLSPYAKMHIWKQLQKADPKCGCQEAVSVALSIPYEQETTHPDRERLVQHARYIDTHFIQPDREAYESRVKTGGDDSDPHRFKEQLVQLVQFLIDHTGVKATAKSVANEARAENIQLAKEKEFLADRVAQLVK